MPATSALLQEGRYRLDHPVSETSESLVFQGYDTVRDTKVVVKEIVALPSKEDVKLNFANQAKTLASVRHDSLIHVEDYFSEVGRQYLVLEAVEGDDLQSLLENKKAPFTLEEAASWAEQILDALHYLHTFDPPMLHRRVRPKNIRRLIDGRVKLLAYSSPDSDAPVSTGITNDETELNYSPLELIWDGLDAASQKVIVGDYDDRSEKILKSPPDARSDIYSVGASLYYLLTGRIPVDPLERSIEMLEGNPDPLKKPCDLDSSIPTDVSDVIMRAMEIKRENRFDSAVIMRQVLRTAVNKVDETEEDRELAEAAETLRMAEKAREEQARKIAEQKAREAEEEKLRAAELQAQKDREAEQIRLDTERKAAEAKEKQKSKEARKKEAELAAKASEAASDDKPLERVGIIQVDALDEILEDADEQFVSEEPKSAVLKSAPDQKSIHESEAPFSYEETKSGSKVPLIIGAFVVLVLAGVGIWVFLGSGPAKQPAPVQSAATTAAPAAPAAAAEQTSVSEPAPSQQSAVPSPSESDPQAAPAEPSQARTSAKPGPAKASRPAAEPAKTPEKKKVTVDDLINDN